jgi:hypothetical protein
VLIPSTVYSRLRSTAFACSLLGLLGCPRDPRAPEQPQSTSGERRTAGELGVDPSRCAGDALDLVAIVRAGSCTIPAAEAVALPEGLVIEAPRSLAVLPGERLEFELMVRNLGTEPLVLDLRFRRFLPLGPEHTVRLADGPGPDESCTLRAISTEPPPERITLPAGAVLAIPCEWHANARLVDPHSYVGSECADFPGLAPGRYRSVFRIDGGAGSRREVTVEIDVHAPRVRGPRG